MSTFVARFLFFWLLRFRQPHVDVLQGIAVAGQFPQGPALLPSPGKNQGAQISGLARRQQAPTKTAVHGDDLPPGQLGALRPKVPEGLLWCGDLGHHLLIARQLLLQFLGCTRGQYPSVAENEHPMTDHFRLGQDVRGQQHGVPAGQAFDQPPDRPDLMRIQPDGGFVQDDQLGLMHQGISQAHPLAIALGQLPDQAAVDLG
jgi:hypothetical protein